MSIGNIDALIAPQIDPKGDRVLVKVSEQEEKTRGGILLPTSAQKRPTSGGHSALGLSPAPPTQGRMRSTWSGLGGAAVQGSSAWRTPRPAGQQPHAPPSMLAAAAASAAAAAVSPLFHHSLPLPTPPHPLLRRCDQPG